jgi:DNA-binding CsgD family transcriptional regulator
VVKKTVLIFGMLCTGLLLFFRYGEFSLWLGKADTDLLLVGVALIFFILGAILYGRYNSPRREKRKPLSPGKLHEIGLTTREQQVLQEICHGLSNREIAEKLFVSEHTIKTHVSNLLVKLGVKRRTQAIQLARELELIP